MSRDTAVAEALRLQSIMRAHKVVCTVELTAGRAWSGDQWYSRKQVLFNHHTAGSMRGLTPSYALCRNGRPARPGAAALPGPLCNGYGGRDHVYRIITLGLGNHPGQGGPLSVAGFTVPADSARISAWGTEWEHDGVSPWPEDMCEFMARSNAALLEWLAIPVGRSVEHSTWAPTRKIDRNGYSAARGQREIKAHLSTGPTEDDDMTAHAEQLDRIERLLTEKTPLSLDPKATATPLELWRWTQGDAYAALAGVRAALAEIAGLRAALFALSVNPDLTAEQITAAAQDGAGKALDERITGARVELTAGQ